MLRYVISLPGDIRPWQLDAIREMLAAAANDREWRDVVLAQGGTITDMRPAARALAARRRAVGTRIR